MSDQYIGEVRLVGFNFAPEDWAFCAGQSISISQNPTLFNLIGTTYGGDGQNTFALPDLRGRIPIHQGFNGASNYVLGQTGGVEMVTLTIGQYPAHSHSVLGSPAAASSNKPANNAVGAGLKAYSSEAPTTPMNAAMVGSSGGGNLPHNNLQPYLALNWIIALYGIYPTQD
jgi:microcystin-dependent protein